MSLVSLKNAVTSKFALNLLKVRKASPTLMFVGGVVGIGATVYLACRATLRVEETIEEARTEIEFVKTTDYDEDLDRTKDLYYVYGKSFASFAKLFGPPVILGVTSIAMLTGSHVILHRRNLAVTAAYAALDKGFKQYRSRVTEKYGTVEDQTLRHGLVDKTIVEDTETGPVTRTVKVPGKNAPSIYAKIFDENNRNWNRHPSYNQIFIQCQQNYANDLLRARGHVTLNEVYDLLGMDRTKEGFVVGWVNNSVEGDGYIDFGVFSGDTFMGQQFANGDEKSVWLDFNVDGVIYDKI